MLSAIKKYSSILFMLFIVCETLHSQTSLDSSLAFILFNDKDYESAAKHYKKLYSSTENDRYLVSYVNCLYKLNKYEKAEKLVSSKINKDNNPELAMELKNIRNLYFSKSGWQKTTKTPVFKGWLWKSDKNRYNISGTKSKSVRPKEKDDKTEISKDSLNQARYLKYSQDSLNKINYRRKRISSDSVMAFNHYLKLEYEKAGELFYRLYNATGSKLYLSFYLNTLIKENKIKKARRMVRREIKNTGDFSLMKTFRDFAKYENKYLQPDMQKDSAQAFNYLKEKNYFDASEKFRVLYNNTEDTLYLKYYLYSLKELEDYQLATKIIDEELEKKNKQYIIDNITDFNIVYQIDTTSIIEKTYHKDSLNIYEINKDSLLFNEEHVARNDLLFRYSNNKLIVKYQHDIFDGYENTDIKDTKYYSIINSLLGKVINREISIFDYYRENYVIGIKLEDIYPLYGITDTADLNINPIADSVNPGTLIDKQVFINNFCQRTGKLFFVENWHFNTDDLIFKKHIYAIGPYLRDTTGYISYNNYIENVPFISFMEQINNINIDPENIIHSESIIALKDIQYEFNLYNQQYSDLMDDDSFRGTIEEFKDWFRNKNDWCKNLNGDRLVNLIITEVLSGSIKAYDHNTDSLLSIDEVSLRCGKKTDTIWVTDFFTGLEFMHLVEEDININDFHKIIFIEDWYYDKSRFSFKKIVKGIALVRTEKIFISNRQTMYKENVAFKVKLNTIPR